MSDHMMVAFAPAASRPGHQGGGREGSGRRGHLPWFGGGGSAGRLAGWYAAIRAMVHVAWRRHRTRDCLSRMDRHLLKDIGITYAEAEAEVNKPFWIV